MARSLQWKRTGISLLLSPEAMKVDTLHCLLKFPNETNIKVRTSIVMQLPSNNFPFMEAMEACMSRSQFTAYKVLLPR